MDAVTAPAHSGPARTWTYLEAHRTLGELAAYPVLSSLLALAPKGDGHPVIALPGFLASDTSTLILRRFLTSRGYETYPWDMGRNLGPQILGEGYAKLSDRIRTVSRDNGGRKVSLVGWSLGGIMAREIAKREKDTIRQVISLGSPFAGAPEGSRAWPFFRFLYGDGVHSEEFRSLVESLAQAPEDIPTTSVYTRTDGIVHWTSCVQQPAALTDNIEVQAAHCALGFSAPALYAIADRLAQHEGKWRPFSRTGWRKMIYPFAGHQPPA